MSDKLKNIFALTDCLSQDVLMDYAAGKLAPAQKRAVELHLADCEMCSDAVEGLSWVGDRQKMQAITSELNKKVQERVSKKEGKVIFLYQYRTQLAVAASVVVLLGLVWFFRSQMQLKELDPATSEQIFADKFEPYSQENEEKAEEPAAAEAPPPVTEVPADVKKSTEDRDREVSFADENRSADVVTLSTTKEENKSTAFYRAEEAEKQKAEAYGFTTSEQAPVRDESVLSEKKTEALKKDNAQQIVFSTNSASTTAVPKAAETKSAPAKDKELSNDDRAANVKAKDLPRQAAATPASGMNQEAELTVLETRSGKKRSKMKKSEVTSEGNKPQPITAESPAEEQGDVTTTGAISQIVAMDSVKADLQSQPADADLAMRKYEEKDFAGAAADFEATLKNDPDNYNALFYSAVSYLGTGETDKAITNLNKVLLKKDGNLYDAAQWYLSLAYIKKSDTDNARKNLMELKENPKSRYQKQADETLRQMQK